MIKPSRVDYSKKFEKQLRKAPLEIKMALLKRREIFSKDPLNPILNNHSLTGKYLNKRSINITGDWRAIYSESTSEDEKVVTFEFLGTHSQLYG